MPYDTPTAPTSNFSIRERDDHMDEALVCLRNALDCATDPAAVHRNIENARAHLVAFNNWPNADAIGSRPVEVA